MLINFCGRFTDFWLCGMEGRGGLRPKDRPGQTIKLLKRFYFQFTEQSRICVRVPTHSVEVLGRDPIILERQAVETSMGSYLRCCRICLHLAGTPHPNTAAPDPASDEVHTQPLGVGNRFPNREVLRESHHKKMCFVGEALAQVVCCSSLLNMNHLWGT